MIGRQALAVSIVLFAFLLHTGPNHARETKQPPKPSKGAKITFERTLYDFGNISHKIASLPSQKSLQHLGAIKSILCETRCV